VVTFLQAHPDMTLQHDNATSHTARSGHDFLQDRFQGHIIQFLSVTCLWKFFSLCLSCLCSYKYLHMLNLLKMNAVDSERTFLFLLSLYG
jgi:hypothetical protein